MRINRSTTDDPAHEAELFSALGHPVRLQLVTLVADGPHCACELEPKFNLNQSTISRHLATLQQSGVLHSYKEGVKVMYTIRDERVLEIIDRARDLTDDALRRRLGERQEVN